MYSAALRSPLLPGERLSGEAATNVETAVKYEGYIGRQQKAVEKMLRLENMKIPETFEDYLNKWVYGCKDQAELLDKIGGSRLMRLKNEPHLGYSTTH